MIADRIMHALAVPSTAPELHALLGGNYTSLRSRLSLLAKAKRIRVTGRIPQDGLGRPMHLYARAA